MTEKRFELEVLNDVEYVIAEFDKDNYYLNDENSAKALECRLNELYDENEQLKNKIPKVINKKINELENDLNRAVKAGMPTALLYDEIESLKELKKELGE